MNARGAVIAVAGLVLFLAVAIPYASESIQVDRCLDSGGSYDYSKSVCDFSVQHPFVPYMQRHPRTLPLAALGLAVAAAGIFIASRSRQSRAP